ncbi:DUF4105 domain-containing protein [Prevotella sp. E13-17]|uniref:lipoprotein N-acyltransferase Lnb domain-containing protein n=1 Tax=Prevotella sp. E13-17 TaxID=2913616 RepID=UPI001EDC0800|nr:DUF4105 domain-containing protein [Prevotella sp. E13-17]UKK49871.1 DUF4105 domain-containing protein [Prevotella sp. E13-17]
MKQFIDFFRTIFLVFTGIIFACTTISADEKERLDSIEIGLVTCAPHEEIYSLYGHSAIRVHDYKTGQDLVFNYGVFNFNQPFFVLRFALGIPKYELGIIPYNHFCKYYKDWGSQVTEQVLNITSGEKQRIIQALSQNYRPENRTYTYNVFYDNCSTRPRDLIEKCIQGEIVYTYKDNYMPSFREMTHEYTKGHPWATFGNDILLGVKADLKTNARQQEFLPFNLRNNFDHAKINRNGVVTPLVKERRELVAPGVQVTEEGFSYTPTECSLFLLCLTIIILGLEYYKRTIYIWFDILLMLLTGIAGCVLTILFFSQHPTTSTNLQILVLNPIALAFIPNFLKKKKSRWFHINAIFIIIFFIGSFWQDYAEGMEIVALCLLLRIIRHYNDK